VLSCGDNFLFLSGQACLGKVPRSKTLTNAFLRSLAASRVLVQSSIAEAFIAGLKERFKSVPMDQDPSQETTILGPLVDKTQFDRVMSYLESGKNEAELIVGGQCGSGSGLYIQPTIFLNPKKDAKIYREEIFGPVLTVLTFETEEEALELANDTTYGLSGTCSF
jgi:aldehyde dehydrogenase (NAD+)